MAFRDFRKNAEKRYLFSEMWGLETGHLAVLFSPGRWDSQEKMNMRKIKDCKKCEGEQKR